MDKAAVKESRRILRRVQEHLYAAHNNLGVTRETIGMMDVLHHPESTLASLNYCTPRRNTAWVPAEAVREALEFLQSRQRVPRVQYIEGLYPPLFAKTLRDLNLTPECELPLMVYMKEGFNGTLPPPFPADSALDNVSIEQVRDQRGVELWWYVWRNAHYDVMSLGVEPLLVGRDMAALAQGHQLDILLHRAGFPVGVARVSIYNQTAHLLGLALMKEARTAALTRRLMIAAIEATLERGCTLVYAPGETEADRLLCRELGFLNFGSIICYVLGDQQKEHEARDDHILGQPVLTLR